MEYTDYNHDDLKRLQNLQLNILEDFIGICEEHDIEYFMYGGSMIGAVRHNGFIPWDDDIDVIMFRNDYERFVEIFEMQHSSKYELLTAQNTDDYFLLFSKISLKGTRFSEWWSDQVGFDLGIYLDIFVLDGAPENSIMREIHMFNARVLARFITVSTVKLVDYPFAKQSIANFFHYAVKLFRIPSSFFKRKALKLLKKYDVSNSKFVFDSSSKPYPMAFLKKDFSPAVKVQFEDIEVCIPNNYDKVLKGHFGDYMTVPPEEDRYNHVTREFDFGPYSP